MSWAQFFLILATIHIARVMPTKTSFWLAYVFLAAAAVSLWRAHS